ncbi:hypothetical protein [Pedobacter sp. L105]|uniref:hypothetical protein n=1 Tax=Pedobacter sp. L105 TaxID=1641871 RepID=UPI00131C866F|nr:hypothetical protein [Pedobacter sp. L105]
MSYHISRFEVEFKGKNIPVAIHAVTDEDGTNHIVSIDGHENFEIRPDIALKWKAEANTSINDDLLTLITEKYESSK